MRETQFERRHTAVKNRIIPAHAGNSAVTSWDGMVVPDHPRACGELNLARALETISCGSSPRMRGTRCIGQQNRPLLRIIPAHAGNSTPAALAPRIRRIIPAHAGNSTPAALAPRIRRIIPAHAGNSNLARALETISPDHPRACGELPCSTARSSPFRGSSPRMRGTPNHPRACDLARRIIPAHAGNSPARPRARAPSADHPRACGELRFVSPSSSAASGSSPRMRGTPHPVEDGLPDRRIIPAHAGNSVSSNVSVRSGSDHPRACGELAIRRLALMSPHGSSPRMRGTPAGRLYVRAFRRIIPAHAGNSNQPPFCAPRLSDHPRACGELRLTEIVLKGYDGSSPRMRGTLFPRTTTNTGFI